MPLRTLIPCICFTWYFTFISGIQPVAKLIPAPRITADSTVTVTFSAVGDLMCHSDEFLYAQDGKDEYDFKPFFSYIKPIIQKSDIALANFETVLAGAGSKYSGYPFFNSPDTFADAVRDAGFSVLTCANNHCLDRGEKGILRTQKVLHEKNFVTLGTNKSWAERDSIRLVTVKGLKIALLAYSYNTNGNPIPKGKEYLVNVIDTCRISTDLQAARPKADIVLVFFHFGEEYQRYPNSNQEKLVRLCISQGADIILGSHPHVIQPMQKYAAGHGAKLDSVLCVYSMGNFISGQRWRYSDAGCIITFLIEKNVTRGTMNLKELQTMPTWVYKGRKDGRKIFSILPASSDLEQPEFSFLSPVDKAKAREAYQDSQKKLWEYLMPH
ncbi:MAG: CapA family protein [Ignavibacteria bacterium]|nr:CapA family protein [Ignavibacteria bacterium]